MTPAVIEACLAAAKASGAVLIVDAAPPPDLGAALVGRQLLYWWPDDGWQRGTVARLCPRGAFSHVVAYTRQTSALRGTADSLLDSASYGTRRVGAAITSPRASRRSGHALETWMT